jgi:hypothetical protein
MTCKSKNQIRLKFLDSTTEITHDAFITTRYYHQSNCTYIMIYIYSNTEEGDSLINPQNDNSAVNYKNKSYIRYDYRVDCLKAKTENSKTGWASLFKPKDVPKDVYTDYLTQFYDKYVNNFEFNNKFLNGILKGHFFCGNLEEVRNNFKVEVPKGGYSKKSKKKYNKRIYGIHKKSKHRRRLQTRKNKGQRYK